MATNDILQFAGSAAGADILTQVAYAADTDRTSGHKAGIARRALENKALKQASTIAATVAQFMADSQASNVDDAVSVATLTGYLKTAIKNVAIMFTSAAGAADALTAAFTPASTALADGDFLVIRAASANATATPTLAVDGLTAKTIVKGSNAALAVGDIAGAGFYLLVSYDATLDKYVLHNPYTGTAGAARQVFCAREVRASGVDAGTFTSGAWRTRILNSLVTNTITGTSLAVDMGSGLITPIIPAGTYKVTASAPALEVNRHKCRLYDITNTATLMIGSTENTTAGAGASIPVATRSTIMGILTLASPTAIELQHRCSATQSTNGFGEAAAFGEDELYAELLIETL